MKIQYLSDIHLELLFKGQNNLQKYVGLPNADMCVLAGDIGNPFDKRYKDYLLLLSPLFKKIFIIAGNHEYYNNTILDTKHKIKSICENIDNISFLDNSYEEYENYVFIGTTLWTHVKENGYRVNDIEYIRHFDIKDYNSLHDESVQFLKNIFNKCQIENKRMIILTHHLPIYELTNKKYRYGSFANYAQWFNADLDDLIEKYSPNIMVWFYGHTHTPSIQEHYGVQFYCNPLGYQGENKIQDIMNKICEVD